MVGYWIIWTICPQSRLYKKYGGNYDYYNE